GARDGVERADDETRQRDVREREEREREEARVEGEQAQEGGAPAHVLIGAEDGGDRTAPSGDHDLYGGAVGGGHLPRLLLAGNDGRRQRISGAGIAGADDRLAGFVVDAESGHAAGTDLGVDQNGEIEEAAALPCLLDLRDDGSADRPGACFTRILHARAR